MTVCAMHNILKLRKPKSCSQRHYGVCFEGLVATHPSWILDESRLTTVALVYMKEPRVSTATSLDNGVIESLVETKA